MTTNANRGLSRRAAIGGVAAVAAAIAAGGKPSGAAATSGLAAPADVTDVDSPDLERWLLTTCPDPKVRLSLADVVAT